MALAEVCREVRYGYTASATEEPTGTRFLRVTDIARAAVDWKTVPFCEISAADFERYRLEPGDIVIARMGTIGVSALIREPVRAVCASYLIRHRIEDTCADARFVAYVLRSPSFWDFVWSHGGGGAVQPNINATVLGRFRFQLPSLPEQRTIAHILGTLDDKIDLNRRMNQTLEQMAQAIFKSWFIDFDGQTEFVESELGEVPVGWEVERLGDLLTVLETGNRPKGGVAGITDGVPSIGAESIVRLGEFDYSKTKFVPREYFNSLKRGIVEDRDVLLYKDGGKPGDFQPHVAMFGDNFPFHEFALNSHVYRLRIREPISQEFLYFWLASEPIMSTMRRLGTGVAIPGLSRRNLELIPFLIPQHRLMTRFSDVSRVMVTRILHAANESRTLAALRDTLLPKLISGEIRVPEAEHAIEATQ